MPINVEPEYVSHVIVQDSELAFGICVQSDIGGVHEMDVADVPDTIVPDASLNLYFSVCVKAELLRLMLIFSALPITPVEVVETSDTRGMVGSSIVKPPDGWVYPPQSE